MLIFVRIRDSFGEPKTKKMLKMGLFFKLEMFVSFLLLDFPFFLLTNNFHLKIKNHLGYELKYLPNTWLVQL